VSQENKPSKESLREVKREYKQRQKDEKARKKAADKYWAEQVNPGKSSRSGSAKNGVQVTLAAVAIASVGFLAFGALRGSATLPSALPATGSTQPSVKPSPSATKASASSSPAPCKFCGTPAEHWAVGDHGLIAPKAVRVGNFGPHQVSDAYSKVIDYLKAATLDPAVVFHGKLAPVFATLGSETTAWVHKQHERSKSTKGKQGTTWAEVANRLQPADWENSGEIRVRNLFTTEPGRGSDELKIHFVNITAYYLKPKDGMFSKVLLIRREGNMYFYEASSSTVSEPSYGGSGYTSSASVCGSNWRNPDFVEAWTNPDSVASDAVAPLDNDWDMSDPKAAIPKKGLCFRNTSPF
jgi:hypothetical protein